MPEKYLKIRDSLVKKGKALAAAKTSAAKIFNASRKRGEAPVSPSYEKRRGKK